MTVAVFFGEPDSLDRGRQGSRVDAVFAEESLIGDDGRRQVRGVTGGEPPAVIDGESAHDVEIRVDDVHRGADGASRSRHRGFDLTVGGDVADSETVGGLVEC